MGEEMISVAEMQITAEILGIAMVVVLAGVIVVHAVYGVQDE